MPRNSQRLWRISVNDTQLLLSKVMLAMILGVVSDIPGHRHRENLWNTEQRTNSAEILAQAHSCVRSTSTRNPEGLPFTGSEFRGQNSYFHPATLQERKLMSKSILSPRTTHHAPHHIPCHPHNPSNCPSTNPSVGRSPLPDLAVP